jgi:dienelactone hydrolase
MTPVGSEIYQVTGPVERFAGQIASQGFVVACPSSFHEFEGPDPIPYDTEGAHLTHVPPRSISLMSPQARIVETNTRYLAWPRLLRSP